MLHPRRNSCMQTQCSSLGRREVRAAWWGGHWWAAGLQGSADDLLQALEQVTLPLWWSHPILPFCMSAQSKDSTGYELHRALLSPSCHSTSNTAIQSLAGSHQALPIHPTPADTSFGNSLQRLSLQMLANTTGVSLHLDACSFAALAM